MIRVSNAQIYVHDQDEALAFYTEKLGWEVRADVTLPEMGNFRWLNVAPPNQEDFAVILMAFPGPPVFEEDSAAMIREATARGIMSPLFLSTDDCQASFEELTARGVEFVDEPFEQPYGIDSSFRDPSGNHIRLTQVKAMAEVK